MGLFYDPIDGPPSSQQKLGMILYAVLALISVWATGESLSKTFEFPILISYLVGLAIVLIMAAMLSIIKNAIEERSLVALLVGLVSFFLVWGISLTTNTHNFYLKGSLKDIQAEELKDIKKELEGVQVNSFSIVNKATTDYRLNVSNKISNYKKEVLSNNNPGHGPVADSLKAIIEEAMPGAQFPVLSKTSLKTEGQRRKFAEKMGLGMKVELDNRIASMQQKKTDVDNLVTTTEYTDVLDDVNNHLLTFFNSNVDENRGVISRSYSFYNGLKYNVSKILDLPSPITITPGSIKLEHISNTFEYMKDKKGFGKSEFIFAFLLALGVDLGAFVIFYFMVLKKND